MYGDANRLSWYQIFGAPPPLGMRQIVACIESVTYASPLGAKAMSLGNGGRSRTVGEQGALTRGGRHGLRSGKAPP